MIMADFEVYYFGVRGRALAAFVSKFSPFLCSQAVQTIAPHQLYADNNSNL